MSLASKAARLPFVILSLLLLMLVSGVGGAFWHYRRMEASEKARLREALAEAAARQRVLEGMVERLKTNRRMAQIVVTDQAIDDAGNVAETTLLFVELGPDGEPLSRQCFTIPGDTAFFDALVIKFDEESVAMAHPLRGQSLALMRRVYSDRLRPRDGFGIDEPGEAPAGYRVHAETDEAAKFQQRLWDRFWDLANDPKLAAEQGVRVAQGEAVYKPLKPGVFYELTLDVDGGLNLVPGALPDAVAEVLAEVSDANMP